MTDTPRKRPRLLTGRLDIRLTPDEMERFRTWFARYRAVHPGTSFSEWARDAIRKQLAEDDARLQPQPRKKRIG